MDFNFPDGASPLADYSDLLLPWVQNLGDLNRVEAENISEAQKKYLRPFSREVSTWFHFQELLSIHRAMFGKVWAWAGKIRKSTISIGIASHLIPLRIAELCKEVASWSIEPVELTFLEKSARIHHSLTRIHPFENGNGRFSRLIADRCFLSWKCPYPIWPDDLHHKGNSRKLYIETLRAADQGNYEPLICLMKDLGAADPDLSTLLQESFYRPYIQGLRGISKIKAMLRKGQDPNHSLKNGHLLLQLIIKEKLDNYTKLGLIKLFIEYGAKIDRIDKSGLTPFQTAVEIENKEIALFLRSKGALPLAPPGVGYTKYYNLFHQLPPN